MKVIVRCANNRVTKAEMEREIERLFQENKDLRLSESHLRDALNLIQQQSEARRQVICERDKLIQELNEQVQASEDELREQTKQTEKLKTKMANVGAERDNFEAAYKQVLQWWEAAQSKAVKAEAAADEYHIALMESDCRVDECEKRMDWLSKEVLEWKATAEGYKNQYEELKAQKEADDKKSEEICTACNERYEEVLSERNHLRAEVVRLTEERNTAVHENTEMMFEINELQDKWEAEHNLRAEAEKAYDKVASEAYDMHQQITNLTIDNTRLENKVEELEAEVDTCRHNIDGYIEGNRRMRAEYEKKLEAEQDQTKHWRKKYEELMEEHNELETDYDALVQTKREYGEEIDRLRKVVTELQSTRFTTDEFIGMIMKNFMPSADK